MYYVYKLRDKHHIICRIKNNSELLLIIVACVGVWLRVKWERVKNYCAERGVPHYPPHPILGSLTFLQKDNPEKLHQELVEAKQNYGKELDSSALAELPYLNAVKKEALRKFPLRGWLDRIAGKDYKLDDKLTIPAGTVVYVNGNGIMSDPEFFPDPDVFNPDRFLSENETNIQLYTYPPFGEGPRICIDILFVYLSMRFGLAAVVQNFSIRPVKDGLTRNECSVENKGMFLVPSGKMSLIFTAKK